MQKVILVFTVLIATGFFPSCKKGDPTYCWQLYDFAGNEVIKVCDKTEAEIKSAYPNAFYHLADEAKYCWLISNNTNNTSRFLADVTESVVKHFNPTSTYTKVECGYCAFWFSREKRTFKPANSITYSPVLKSQYCGDTARTIFHGRQVTRKDSPDSLIVIQFSKDGTSW